MHDQKFHHTNFSHKVHSVCLIEFVCFLNNNPKPYSKPYQYSISAKQKHTIALKAVQFGVFLCTKVPLWVQFITKEKEVFLFASPFFFLFVFLFLFVSITRRNVYFGCENERKKFSVSIHFAFPLFRGNVAWDEIEAESRIAPFGTSLIFQNTPAAIYFFYKNSLSNAFHFISTIPASWVHGKTDAC